ncbi:hypothetical protein FEM48_Zijuj01G0202000 [Ziziphus jujuba var. spinosa]|uniref:Reverse transcriptase/retrotransposon-derived protein RNase H-like domain-containing protein n=1 Tax=Ziziphus jujuba var. spinosa TaxID=714518 RepID=A0A978W3B5_ZIZJJ|nr:hypothetical protein FEM48_Zijuj01G0202000 [Ziziphus jujuba var. spinosa]
MSKCKFGVTRVDYLGHVIFDQGFVVDPSKIEAVLPWPTPTSAKEVRGFLEAEESFQRLKKALTSTLVLGLPNFSQPFVIQCDANGSGLGVRIFLNITKAANRKCRQNQCLGLKDCEQICRNDCSCKADASAKRDGTGCKISSGQMQDEPQRRFT